MSYVVQIWDQPSDRPPPHSIDTAVRLLSDLHGLRAGQNPKFLALAQRLVGSGLCRCMLCADECEDEDLPCAWLEGPPSGCTDSGVYNLGLGIDVDGARELLLRETRALNLNVMDEQAGEVHLADGTLLSVRRPARAAAANDPAGGAATASSEPAAKGAAPDAATARVMNAAAQGVAAAQFSLGLMYASGRGIAKDAAQAVAWLRKAAAQGHAEARQHLGVCYLKGEGVVKDLAAGYALLKLGWQGKAAGARDPATIAAQMTRQAVAAGDALAQALAEAGDLSSLLDQRAQENKSAFDAAYQAGRHEDYATALAHLRPLAEIGHPEAQFMLGLMYDDGRGVPKDDGQAFKWFLAAARSGHAWGQHNVATMFEQGRGVAQDLEVAAKWYQSAAGNGDDKALVALKDLRARMRSEEALQAERARHLADAEDGDAEAQCAVGDMYLNGDGVAKDLTRAAEYFGLAAQQEYPEAQYRYGLAHFRGEGLPKNFDAAVNWFRCAGANGHAAAQHALGIMYQHGLGVPQDNVAAMALFSLSKLNGNPAEVKLEFQLGEAARVNALLKEMARPGNLLTALDGHFGVTPQTRKSGNRVFIAAIVMFLLTPLALMWGAVAALAWVGASIALAVWGANRGG